MRSRVEGITDKYRIMDQPVFILHSFSGSDNAVFWHETGCGPTPALRFTTLSDYKIALEDCTKVTAFWQKIYTTGM